VSDGLFGGRATSVSDALADTWGGLAESSVRAVSGATRYATSRSDGVGVAVSGRYRSARADVRAESRAHRFGNSRVNAAAVEIRD